MRIFLQIENLDYLSQMKKVTIVIKKNKNALNLGIDIIKFKKVIHKAVCFKFCELWSSLFLINNIKNIPTTGIKIKILKIGISLIV